MRFARNTAKAGTLLVPAFFRSLSNTAGSREQPAKPLPSVLRAVAALFPNFAHDLALDHDSLAWFRTPPPLSGCSGTRLGGAHGLAQVPCFPPDIAPDQYSRCHHHCEEDHREGQCKAEEDRGSCDCAELLQQADRFRRVVVEVFQKGFESRIALHASSWLWLDV
ncbi:hypothetical protein ebA3090 [Aromatoleum aromaticum EbN1]|uniref:Uncharacterized protein n=1 Tax=Aromatoleum aromaticum (strain DSM 19018 / LMG 30748 / EbN1) TaxID=76114 RepID=Q5P498_AROAE|nr:hypothetical protein ebA3090 [Aromatoleum aromaticum EbN1]